MTKTAPRPRKKNGSSAPTEPRPMQSCHVMIDLETMSTAKNAAILSIGAVLFDPFGRDTEDTLSADGRWYYTTISLDSNEREDRHISAGTVMWWMRQDKAAQDALLTPMSNLRQALTGLRMWIQEARPSATRVWAKSPDFDVAILQDAFSKVNEIWPFKFWESRCVRTVIEAAYPDDDAPKIGVGTAHNALDDARRQVLSVQNAYHVIHQLRKAA